ncbi:MAG: phage major capsid protein [Candidatus Sedimenticola sp. 20ELBAFRAG]
MSSLQNITDAVTGIEEKIKRFHDDAGVRLTECQDRLLALEQRGTGFIPMGRESKESVATQIAKSPEVQNFIDRKTRNAGVEVDTKTLLPALETKNTVISSDATNPAQQVPGVVGGPQKRAWLRQLLPNIIATSASFVYTRELSYTNSADAQSAEAVDKPESAITFEEVTGTISTYAHWLKMSRQVMSDNAALVGFTEQRLRYGLELKIEDALINGDGTLGTISGLLDVGNFSTFVPTLGDTAMDSLRKAKLALESADYQTGLFILNPTDVSSIELLKDANGEYIVGKPIQGGLTSIWGVPVYVTTALTAGTFVALDVQQAVSLHLRENTLVEFSDSDDDNFTKNLITILAETRLGFAVHLPAGVRSGSLTA